MITRARTIPLPNGMPLSVVQENPKLLEIKARYKMRMDIIEQLVYCEQMEAAGYMDSKKVLCLLVCLFAKYMVALWWHQRQKRSSRKVRK